MTHAPNTVPASSGYDLIVSKVVILGALGAFCAAGIIGTIWLVLVDLRSLVNLF